MVYNTRKTKNKKELHYMWKRDALENISKYMQSGKQECGDNRRIGGEQKVT